MDKIDYYYSGPRFSIGFSKGGAFEVDFVRNPFIVEYRWFYIRIGPFNKRSK